MAKRQAPKAGFRARTKPLQAQRLLAELQKERKKMLGLEQRLVDQLRAAGTTWREIAELTGANSPQAARYRFTRHHPPKSK